MNKKVLIVVAVIVVLIVAYGLVVISGQRQEDTQSREEQTEGTILSIDRSQVPADGPTIIEIETRAGIQEIAVPSMGINLCAARENIADISTLKVGDRIEVSGISEGPDARIVPCEKESYYLRVVEN